MTRGDNRGHETRQQHRHHEGRERDEREHHHMVHGRQDIGSTPLLDNITRYTERDFPRGDGELRSQDRVQQVVVQEGEGHRGDDRGHETRQKHRHHEGRGRHEREHHLERFGFRV